MNEPTPTAVASEVWVHVDDHNGGMWMREADWLAWINERRDVEIMPLLGVQYDGTYVSAAQCRAHNGGDSPWTSAT